MSLYHDYLNSKTEVFSKELKFKTAVTEWFDKHNLHLLQPVELSDSITLDLVIISTTKEFEKYLGDFENEFGIKCIRIFHKEVIIPNEESKEYWKFHFKEQ